MEYETQRNYCNTLLRKKQEAEMRYNAVTQINRELVEENNELKMLNPL